MSNRGFSTSSVTLPSIRALFPGQFTRPEVNFPESCRLTVFQNISRPQLRHAKRRQILYNSWLRPVLAHPSSSLVRSTVTLAIARTILAKSINVKSAKNGSGSTYYAIFLTFMTDFTG